MTSEPFGHLTSEPFAEKLLVSSEMASKGNHNISEWKLTLQGLVFPNTKFGFNGRLFVITTNMVGDDMPWLIFMNLLFATNRLRFFKEEKRSNRGRSCTSMSSGDAKGFSWR